MVHISPPVVLLAVLLLSHSIFAWTLHGTDTALAALLAWGAWLPLALYIVVNSRRFDFTNFVQSTFIGLSLLHSIAIFLQATLDIPIGRINTFSGISRFYGVGHSVSITATQICIGVLGTLAAYLYASRWRQRTILAACLGVQLIALQLSGMRGPTLFTIITAIGFGLHYAIGHKRSPLSILCLSAISALAILVVFIATTTNSPILDFYKSTGSLESAGNVVRLQRWQASLDSSALTFHNSILGIGSGATNTIPNLIKAETITNESSALKVLVELGLLGLALFLATSANAIRRISDIRHADPKYALKIVVFYQIILLLAECLINDMLNTWIILYYFWALVGLAHSAKQLVPATASRAVDSHCILSHHKAVIASG